MGKYLDIVREAEKTQQTFPHSKKSLHSNKVIKFNRHGLAAIHSKILDGEVIYFAKDYQAATKAPAGAVTYTLEELKELVKSSPSPAELKKIHEAKRAFNGRIMPSSNENSKPP